MENYIESVLSEWIYQPHIREKIINKTFLEEGPIVLNKLADEEYLQSPLFRQVLHLCKTVSNAGSLKLTATGNLPVKVVREIYKLGILDSYYEKYPTRLTTENISITVQTARLVAELGGLIKKRGKALSLTTKGIKRLYNYPLLMESILISYGHKLSWGYFDRYENKMIGQYGFGLTLLLLAHYGNETRDSKFYSERYFYHNQRLEREERAHRCYTIRTFDRFLTNLGLVNYKEELEYTLDAYETVSKSDLFDKLIAVNRDFGKIEYSATSGIPLYRLQIELLHTTPPIWREFIVPSNITLEDLHAVIQAVMGWTDSHLHEFIKGEDSYSVRFEAIDNHLDEMGCKDYKGMKINDLLGAEGESIKYLYDMGDYWMHTITLAQVINATPYATSTHYASHFVECLAGERHCPPEDCGGIGGFHEMLEILKDPNHYEYESYLEWLGKSYDPEHFNLQAINTKLASFCA